MNKQIEKWLKDYLNQSKLETFIVGVSGGVDSALVSTLCAMTNIPTILVSMPIHQNKDELRRAHNHMSWLDYKYKNITLKEINLSHVFDSFEMLFADDEHKLALANSRARLRMTTLYQIAQTNAGLVIGTGNKVEDFGVGFFTKYGDGGVDLSPIADLTKTEVRAMAKEIDVNEEIILAPPTDGLWGDDRTDEDQLGATYEELEWAMSYDGKIEDLVGRQKEISYIYNRFNKLNKHKMEPIPVFKKGEVR